MDRRIPDLSERERETLRLLIRGHDAKSAAAALGLSVHTVNERLRDAPRKLGVSSSREAARILAAHEGGTPQYFGDKSFGVGGTAHGDADVGSPDGQATGARRPFDYRTVGAAMIVALVTAIAVLALEDREGSAAPAAGVPPKVVATRSAQGSVIRPGPFLLSVTFDRPMRGGNYSFVQSSPDTYPDCQGQPSLSHDGRTFTLRCSARPGRRYEVWFNRPPYMNFKALNGTPAQPYRLLFRTR